MTNHISTDHTFARIRVTTEAITTGNPRNAPFQDGEVEDYYIPFSDAGSGPLPIHLISFEAENVNNNILLKWEVADQKDVERYEISRSNNGIEYGILGFVKAINKDNKYCIWDNNPNNGLNLYQLKTINLDGSYQIAQNTLKVTTEINKQKLNFYPNPSDKLINVNVEENNFELVVYNSIGQQIMRKPLTKGTNSIDISSLNLGEYHFVIMNGSKSISNEKIEIIK